MMTRSNAVEEVWQWREKIAEKIKDMTTDEQVKYFNERGSILAKEFGLKYPEQKPVSA